MKFPWKIVKVTTTPADKKLEEIANILFPPLRLESFPNKDGTVSKVHVDSSADSNLDAALIDLTDGHNDRTTQNTIKNVADRLIQVRDLLEAYSEIDSEAEYIIVDVPDNDNNFDEIIANDD